ncbi:MAG: exonuclease domain-containing protein [Acidimicrobiales bacterium]
MAHVVQGSFDDLGTPLDEVTFVVLDVETTGGSPSTSSLTEVAAARYRGGERLATFQTLVRPDHSIPPFVTALTGISDAMVANAPTVGAILPSLLEFLGGAVVVGHNVQFDLSFLNHALDSSGRARLANATVDTLALARRLVRDMVPNYKLGTLATTLDLTCRPSHRALNDVLATADLLHNLLERAGSFGIVGLAELLDLPRLVGHPQVAKLRLTTRLPHRPGVYWFTDATGSVLYVGKATDLQSRVRSYFSGDRRPMIGRLLRELHAIHHHVCPGLLTAAVFEGRLIRAWSPPFNRSGKVGRTNGGMSRRSERPRSGSGPRRPRRPRKRESADVGGDPAHALMPLAAEVADLARQQRYEDAARVRDEAEWLRHLMKRDRRVESLRAAGRVLLFVDGDGVVELDGGLLMGSSSMCGTETACSRSSGHVRETGRSEAGCESAGFGLSAIPALAITEDGHDHERIVVAQWLHANAEKVRVLETGSIHGMSMPSSRIPRLAELTRRCEAGTRHGSWRTTAPT